MKVQRFSIWAWYCCLYQPLSVVGPDEVIASCQVVRSEQVWFGFWLQGFSACWADFVAHFQAVLKFRIKREPQQQAVEPNKDLEIWGNHPKHPTAGAHQRRPVIASKKLLHIRFHCD